MARRTGWSGPKPNTDGRRLVQFARVQSERRRQGIWPFAINNLAADMHEGGALDEEGNFVPPEQRPSTTVVEGGRD